MVGIDQNPVLISFFCLSKKKKKTLHTLARLGPEEPEILLKFCVSRSLKNTLSLACDNAQFNNMRAVCEPENPTTTVSRKISCQKKICCFYEKHEIME